MNRLKSKEQSFSILSPAQERRLSPAELDAYYVKFQEYIMARRLTNTTSGALTIAPKLKGITDRIAVKVTKALCQCDAEVMADGYENIPEGAVLFAHTHQGILDNFAWIPKMPRHCLILHGADVRKALLLAQLNTRPFHHVLSRGHLEPVTEQAASAYAVRIPGHCPKGGSPGSARCVGIYL